MNVETWAVVMVALIAGLCTVVCAVGIKIAYKDGWDAGRLHERARRGAQAVRDRAERRRAERQRWDAYLAEDPAGSVEDWLAQITAETEGERLASTGERRVITETTGTMRRVTDEFIAAMEASEDAYRKEMGS